MKNDHGFSMIEILVVTLVVTVIGTLGYVAYNNLYLNNDNKGAALVDEVPSVPKLTTREDLTTINSTINSIDLSAVDVQITDLDKELSKF